MRNPGLDLLRTLAIFLVLCRHSDYGGVLYDIGWAGVDLFFVLSGFLVSGLLFNEFRRDGKPRIRRFLLRRGFKIYPAFYFFIFATLCLKVFVFREVSPPLAPVLSEVFFVQNYIPGLWLHTWSLAVEEHFYFFLAIIVSLMAFLRMRFESMDFWMVFAFFYAAVFTCRFYLAYSHSDADSFSFFTTHTRADALLLGALTRYAYERKRTQAIVRLPLVFAGISALLLVPLFALSSESYWMQVAGLPMMHAGFALLVLLAVHFLRSPGKLLNVLTFAGVYSYSIYLWHIMAHQVAELLLPDGSKLMVTAVYFMLALGAGIGFAWLIERPVLKLRDKLVP